MIESSALRRGARPETGNDAAPSITSSRVVALAPQESGNERGSVRFDPLEMEASFEASEEATIDDSFLRLGASRNGNSLFRNNQSVEPQPNPTVFDEEFYLATNPDVAEAVAGGAFPSGLEHYRQFGGNEGRNPNPSFDEAFYLQNNPDVAAAVEGGAFESGFEHYTRHGSTENRLPSAGFDPEGLIAQPPVDPAQREEFIIDQLAQHNDLSTLAANVDDNPENFQALLNILNEDFNVVIRDLNEQGNGPFTTEDLLNVANQLNNLPEHIVEAYMEGGQSIVVTNGDFTLSQEFQDAHPPGLFERNEAGQVLGADGTPIAGDGGTHAYGAANGTGTTFVTLEAIREDGGGNGGVERVDGSDSTLLHELAHGLDNLGGDDSAFQEVSHSSEFAALVNRPEVWAYLETIQNGDFHSDPANVEEHFAELFANYFASPETRAAIPAAAQDYFAGLQLQS